MTFKRVTKFCSLAAMALFAFAALGPANLQLRPGLGFQIEHFLALFTFTSIACLAWPRPFVVGGAFMAASAALEWLQEFTPDRTANLEATLYGAGGALVAALLAALVIRVRRRRLQEKPYRSSACQSAGD
jgi:VanZ family protein